MTYKGRDAAYSLELFGLDKLRNPECPGQARIGIRAGQVKFF